MIETLVIFPRGGEVKWAALGAIVGAVTSVTPAMFCGLVVLPVATMAVGLAFELAVRRVPTRHLACAASFSLVVAAAIVAPCKWSDDRVALSAQTLTLEQLSTELHLPPSAVSASVTFPSLEPTWGEVEQAIDQQTPLRLRAGGCGNGMTILFGSDAHWKRLEPAE